MILGYVLYAFVLGTAILLVLAFLAGLILAFRKQALGFLLLAGSIGSFAAGFTVVTRAKEKHCSGQTMDQTGDLRESLFLSNVGAFIVPQKFCTAECQAFLLSQKPLLGVLSSSGTLQVAYQGKSDCSRKVSYDGVEYCRDEMPVPEILKGSHPEATAIEMSISSGINSIWELPDEEVALGSAGSARVARLRHFEGDGLLLGTALRIAGFMKGRFVVFDSPVLCE